MAVYSKPNAKTGLQELITGVFVALYPQICGIDPQTEPFGTECWWAAVLQGWPAILLIASHVQFRADGSGRRNAGTGRDGPAYHLKTEGRALETSRLS